MALSTNLIAGLSSGIDWRTMIDQLMEVEHKRVDLVENTKSDYEAQLTEWQSFNTKLLALRTAAEGLKDPEDFYLYTAGMSTDDATVDGEDILSVSTSTSAAPGTYTINVTALAQAQKLSSNPFTSKTAALGSAYAGDILINGKVVTISATHSLSDVASSINNLNTGTDPSGVTASVVNYGANDYRLILTSDTTGADGISLLNGSSTNLLQKFGWKDKQAAVAKNAITEGAQSDRFTAHNVAINSLLGLSEERESTGTLKIDTTDVTINLKDMSLTDIKNAINQAMADEPRTDIVASIVSETVDGTPYYRLQIEGTQTFTDESNILNTLGILHNNSAAIAAADSEISANSMTSEGAYITPDTLLVDIDGYLSWTSGDEIVMTGKDTANADVNYAFAITTSTTVSELLTAIESQYADTAGDVIAYVTSDGKIRVDDVAASSYLSVVFTASLGDDPDSQLNFGTFDDGSSPRNREIVEGKDATVEIDGVQVTDSSNTIDDVIEGVTLELVSEDDSTTVTLNIERDTDAIKEKIQDFVDKYNEVMSYITTQFSYDEEEESTGGILFGDSTLRSVKSDVVTILTESIWGVESQFSSFSQIGIENDRNEDNEWTLSIDDDTLSDYLNTHFNDVMSLFVGQGVPSNSSLSYIGHTRDTEKGDYEVHINRAATRGTETGNVTLSNVAGAGADEILTVTQGNSTATIAITNTMTLDDIKNEINEELDNEYAETLVGDQLLYADSTQTNEITAETKWNTIYDSGGIKFGFDTEDIISFSGTDRGGGTVSGTYTISNVATDTVQGLLSAIEDAFSSEVTATVDTSGRIVITDKYVGYSQLSTTISHPTENQFFGTIDVTAGAGDGSQEGRYAMAITATDDGSNHLVLRSDDYGSTSFTISQDTSDNNYYYIIYSNTSNTTESTSGTVHIASSTTWGDVSGISFTNGDEVEIRGTARNGIAISRDYVLNTGNTISGLLTEIEAAYNDQGTIVSAFLRDGKIYVEDTSATTEGANPITLTLTYTGSGSLDLGTVDQNTKRDLDLGLINGTVTGLDVAGTIGEEAATGSGQVLTGNTGNTNTDGLSIKYSGTSNDTTIGNMTLTLGVAELFERLLYNITDSTSDGYVAFKQDSLQDRIDDLEDQITAMEDRLDRRMETMISRFVIMEMALARLQNQSNWLTGQINAASGGWAS